MHVTAFPPHAFESMVERLNAIVEQVYKGNVEMLRAAVDKGHRQRLAELRNDRGVFFTKEDHSCESNTCKAARAANQKYRCVFCKMFGEEETSNTSSSSKKEKKEEKKQRQKRLKKEKKARKKDEEKRMEQEAEKNQEHPTVKDLASKNKQYYLIPECKRLIKKGSDGWSKPKLAIQIKMEMLRLQKVSMAVYLDVIAKYNEAPT